MSGKRRTTGMAWVLLSMILASCQRGIPERGVWRGTLELGDGKTLPFRMSMDLSGAKRTGYFLVGDEKTPIPEISLTGDSLVLQFSEYGAEMRGTWDGRQWSGNYLRHRQGGTKSFPFTAAPETSSPNRTSRVNAPLGDYPVDFQDQAGGETVARLWRTGESLYGTFIAPDGDYGLLSGEPVGEGIQMNRFTGWQAIAIALEPRGEMWSGTFYAASNDKPRPFTLRPRTDLQAEAPSRPRTKMKHPDAPFAFSGLSLSGETVRSTDDRFKGKALIVDIMGTWCHNCLDEAPVLQQLQEQFGKDGLEVVGLSFEINEDPELAKKNLKLYQDRFGLTYTLLFCGSLDESNVSKQLHSQLDNFFAYPTTLFTDRKNRVRAIHSGFRGPGTGEEFKLQVREFQELAKQLVN